jgi:hypothetical protein
LYRAYQPPFRVPRLYLFHTHCTCSKALHLDLVMQRGRALMQSGWHVNLDLTASFRKSAAGRRQIGVLGVFRGTRRLTYTSHRKQHLQCKWRWRGGHRVLSVRFVLPSRSIRHSRELFRQFMILAAFRPKKIRHACSAAGRRTFGVLARGD